ncbi:pyruvate formate lyase family protein [uncultured Thiodictyon sp.]|uniref:pyruvate formate lyase family protein n=1 Tax=uncultured Thiodictyon sp. TaxID=1846217 RepID=UPI0025E02BCB|nr:pyruvate formate lyase family protein [uncultured Thiodictyon sp.]
MSVTNPLSGGGIRVGLDTGSVPPRVQGTVTSFPIPNEDFGKVKTLTDLALGTITLEQFPVVKQRRDLLFKAEGIPVICGELPTLLTEFLRVPENLKLPPYTRRAQALKHVFEHKTPLVDAQDLLPGHTTKSFVGVPIYVDTGGYSIWPELKTVATRAQNPFRIDPAVADRLNREIFPFWLEHKPAMELARYSDYDTADYENRDRVTGGNFPPSSDPPLKKKAGETPKAHELFERVSFYLPDKSISVSHTVPDFPRVLQFGLDGLIARANRDLAQGLASTPQQIEFLHGMIAVFEGAKRYAAHLAEAAQAAGNTTLASICQKVPAQPAETLHEALVCIWICYHLLLQENTNFGLSIGRLDQILNPFYLKDWERLDSTAARDHYTRRAVELVCHFFLRCSDHVPVSPAASEALFAGSGSNQALTLGGCRFVNGTVVDAVNDMTYIILKATELLAIRDPNVHARYHRDVHHRDADGNPLPPQVMDPYLKRICQVNIRTRATPALHGDAAVVPAMASYYAAHEGISEDEALADAYDYASIGCIEENAAYKHYGHTGSTLMVLPAVLELALYGGKHRSDGIDPQSPNLFHGTTDYTTQPLTAMTSMAEFIDAFRFQLDAMVQHIVQCNNYLGRAFEIDRASPLLSGLFTGPANTPDGSGAVFRDVAAGGAKYNSAGIAVIGLADVIDSFCVLETLVFSGKVTRAELLAAMAANFGTQPQEEKGLATRVLDEVTEWLHPGHTPDRLPTLGSKRLSEIRELIRLAPKYGAGIDRTAGGLYDNSVAIKHTHWLTETIQEVFARYRTHRGGRYLPGYWSMTNHAGFGMLTKATPNGRRSGEPFASGITPCPGIVKRNGDPVNLLDHMLSVTSVNPQTVQNGYTYNLSLTTSDPAHFEKDTELFARYMKTFTDENGVLVQMCVSSISDLEDADRAATAASRPGAGTVEKQSLAPFRDLMIRVAGYSAYFVTLSPQMRTEIIRRANFGLATGQEQHPVTAISMG